MLSDSTRLQIMHTCSLWRPQYPSSYGLKPASVAQTMVQQQQGTMDCHTFQTSAGSSRFFCKTLGQKELERSGLLKVASPVSGYTLTVPDGSGPNHHAAIKDPITGTVLRLDGGAQAQVVTPVVLQPQVYSRKFYLTSDIDVAIATLRATTTVSDKTNEKIGTSGTPTGKLSVYPG